MATMYNFRHGLFVHIIKSSKQWDGGKY
jgi:hypothetical protein